MFSWEWNSAYSDRSLHIPDSTELVALSEWLNQDPHLTSSEKLVNKATLLQICLGLGLLLRDATLIQFTEEGGHDEETLSFISQSAWTTKEYDAFHGYLKKVWARVEISITRYESFKVVLQFSPFPSLSPKH